MKRSIVTVDAFADGPYSGNPAAVVILDNPADEDWMRKVAREMNLSETAFLHPIDGGYHLRWLTPKAEVDLCGHATLATAHLLFEDGHVPSDRPVRFYTRSGWVSAEKANNLTVLDFPVNRPTEIAPPLELLDALGIDRAVWVGEYPSSYLVVVGDDTIVRLLAPNMTALESLPRPKVCVTARNSDGPADIVSRLFAPALGVPEDPVNGNSHTALAPYWCDLFGRAQLISYYASARGGEVHLSLENDRVKIGGRAIIVLRG